MRPVNPFEGNRGAVRLSGAPSPLSPGVKRVHQYHMKRTDILVAGGGLAGQLATLVFAQAGFDVTCVDPAPPVTSPDQRSTAFLMPSVDLLDQAGVFDILRPLAAPLRTMRIADASQHPGQIGQVVDFSAAEIEQDCFGYNIPNAPMKTALSTAIGDAASAHMIEGVAVEHMTPRDKEAIMRLSDGRQIRARLVLAADGRDSHMRSLAGIGAHRIRYGQKALVFAVSHALPHDDTSTEIHQSGGPFTLVPLAGHDARRSAIVWMDHGPAIARLANMASDAFEHALNERACGLLGPLRLESPRAAWPIISQIADHLDAPRMALIAEAAHVVPPIGAQGLNMSLMDIATLARLISAAPDIGAPGLLRQFHRARHPDIRMRVHGIDALNRASIAGQPNLQSLRRTGLDALQRIGPLKKTAMRTGLGRRAAG